MRASSIFLLSAATVAPGAYGQDFVSGLLNALNGAGLSSLAQVAQQVANTTTGQALFAALPSQNVSIFAPTNEAFSRVPKSVSTDANMLADILSYHVVSGNFSSDSGQLTAGTTPNNTIGRTLLNNTSLVQLEGNHSQVVIWTRNGSETHILNQASTNTTALTSTKFQNVFLTTVNQVLSPPTNITATLKAQSELSQLVQILSTAKVDLSPSAGTRGFTFFAPNNQAIQAASSTLQSLQSNTTALLTVLQNHIVNGSTVYSTEIAQVGQPISAAGQAFSFSSNSSGTFVTSGSSSAQIVQTDILASNGVVHIINGVLANTNSNPSAASSAVASATSAATAQVTETGPVGAPSSSPSSSSAPSAAKGLSVDSGIMFACAVGLVSVLAGALTV